MGLRSVINNICLSNLVFEGVHFKERVTFEKSFAIISLDYWMNLKEKQISEQDRNANFFFEISKFTKERYRLFIEALKKGSHNHLADVLEIRQKEGRYTSVTTLYFLDYTCMVGKGFLKSKDIILSSMRTCIMSFNITVRSNHCQFSVSLSSIFRFHSILDYFRI
jgi:hypothetical protein